MHREIDGHAPELRHGERAAHAVRREMRRADLLGFPWDDAEYLEGDVPAPTSDARVAHAAEFRFGTRIYG